MRGVPGTYGNGYDGVRKGWAKGVAEALPRTVREDDEVDSVEVDVVVASGLLKAALIGDSAESPLPGTGRLGAVFVGLDACDEAADVTFCCLASMRLWTAARKRAISASSGLLTVSGPDAAGLGPASRCNTEPWLLSSILTSLLDSDR